MGKRVIVGQVVDLVENGRLLINVNGREYGVYCVDGRYFALHNRCPHMGGPLCQGPVTGTTLPVEKGEMRLEYGRIGYIQRCGWHGWEFDIETGQCLSDKRLRVRTYSVSIENEQIVLDL